MSRPAETEETAEAACFAPGLERAFAEAPAEIAGPVERIEGEMPAWLAGTYYLNGPARFRRGEVAYRHWLDGDGCVAALRLDGSAAGTERARLTTRYVESAKARDEDEAGRALYRTFGTGFEGDQLLRGVALASPVNVSVYPFAGTLLAFGEQGLPWELDPETLETRGEHSFGRRLTPISPFSAHPKLDPESGEMVNFGISFATTEPSLTLYRFDSGGTMLWRKRSRIDLAPSVHDFGLSPSWIIVYAAPHVMNVQAFLEGGASVMESLSWEPERGSRLLIYSRETGEPAADIRLPEATYCLHHINAFEEDGRLVLDVLDLEEPAYQDYQPLPELFVDVKPAVPARYRIDIEGGRVESRTTLPLGLGGDFPAHDAALTGKPYDDFWMLGISATGKPGRKFLDHLVHLSWSRPDLEDSYDAPPGTYFAGEPAFAAPPEGAEGPGSQGVIIVPQLDVETMESSFALLDAHNVAAGPLAVLHVGAPLHLAFHSHFEPVE